VETFSDRSRCTIAGELLSLDDIEHGKIRRFRDPRVHSALVCGSASCPTLHAVPMHGPGLHERLETAMREFLAEGCAAVDRERGVLHLSRIFLWFAADFAHPQTMPSWRPTGRRSVALSLRPWLPVEDASWLESSHPQIRFRSYDWTLACRVGAVPETP
jgi:hypothetical protein